MCQNTCSSSVNRGHKLVNEHRGRISQQGANGLCFTVHGNIGV